MNLDDVVTSLRSCLISCKGGIKLESLKKDYLMVVGEPLPYKEFGFPSIESLIRNVPEITVIKKNGELYVEAMPSKTTEHLTKLISRQVSRPKVRRKAPLFRRRNTQISPGYYNTRLSMPGRSTYRTDFGKPRPLMETLIEDPESNNEKPRAALSAPSISPSRRLKNKTNSIVLNSNPSFNESRKTTFTSFQDVKSEVVTEKTRVSPVITSKPKILKPLSERLKNASHAPSTIATINKNEYISPSSLTSNSSQIIAIDSSDPRKELRICASRLNLSSPIYKVYSYKGKDPSKNSVYANLKIGPHTVNTYPEHAGSEEEAEKIAARLALVQLAKDSSNPSVMTVDTLIIKERILSIVTTHHGGVFMPDLPMYYNEQYGEALPHNWQKIVEECPEITQEKGVADKTILCRSIPSSKSEVNSFKELSENNLGEKIQLSPIGPATPDKLKTPEGSFWNVYTTLIISTVEVWVQIINDDNNFADMMNEMLEYYDQTKEPISECIIGYFYVVFEDNRWHRVQCIDMDTENVVVLFIDIGCEEEYKCDVLYPLEKKFCRLPPQAIKVALQGLEDFYDNQIITEIQKHVMNRSFQMEIHYMNVEEDIPTVTFYNINEEITIDINKILFNKILDKFSSKIHVGRLVELYVTHMNTYGMVYAQLNSLAKKTCLLNLLNGKTMSRVPITVMKSSLVQTISFTKMYLVHFDSQWYRARVTNAHDDSTVTLFLIDVGKTVITLKDNLLHLDKISKYLESIPPQAIQIFLHNIDQTMYGEQLVTKFNELVSETDLLLAKIVKITTSGIPWIEIFKRIGPNNMLASINTSLIYEEQLTRSTEDGNNNIKSKRRLERKNSRIVESFAHLNPPAIPDIGQYFDVHVILAAHPGHFIVQPFDNLDILKDMMHDLQGCYNAYEGPKIESVTEGKFYAGKFTDDNWYRVYVTNIIDKTVVSVYLCDYGDVRVVAHEKLRPLKNKFFELPYQAIKAKLVGIQPINTDWTVEDCIRFQQLALRKNFVSIVAESVSDDCSPVNDTVLGLHLIDVGTEEDIYIHKLLIEENRAKQIEGNA